MSTIFQTITNILSSNLKEKEQKTSKIESLGRELRENTDIGEDLSKEIISKKANDRSEDVTELKGDDDRVDCKKSDLQIASSKEQEKEDKFYDCVKVDESISDEKQQVPRSIQLSAPEVDSKVAQVQILSLSVISPGRPDNVLPIPFPTTTSKNTLFSLKEGSKYRIRFHLTVSDNVVNNLRYTYMVWKSGVRVHQTKKMVGTFTPREEPYVYELEEGTTPTGFFARGPFLVKSKFVDDDGNCHLDTTYYFDIRKDWGAGEKC